MRDLRYGSESILSILNRVISDLTQLDDCLSGYSILQAAGTKQRRFQPCQGAAVIKSMVELFRGTGSHLYCTWALRTVGWTAYDEVYFVPEDLRKALNCITQGEMNACYIRIIVQVLLERVIGHWTSKVGATGEHSSSRYNTEFQNCLSERAFTFMGSVCRTENHVERDKKACIRHKLDGNPSRKFMEVAGGACYEQVLRGKGSNANVTFIYGIITKGVQYCTVPLYQV